MYDNQYNLGLLNPDVDTCKSEVLYDDQYNLGLVKADVDTCKYEVLYDDQYNRGWLKADVDIDVELMFTLVVYCTVSPGHMMMENCMLLPMIGLMAAEHLIARLYSVCTVMSACALWLYVHGPLPDVMHINRQMDRLIAEIEYRLIQSRLEWHAQVITGEKLALV